jgi:hypothetical protein
MNKAPPKDRDKGGLGHIYKEALRIDMEPLPPETAEDFLLFALQDEGLAGVVRILRDLFGSNKIRGALNRLPHRDPVRRYTHARRHAVELYAKKHNITPATLMVKLTGINDRLDPKGSERSKLRKARKYLEQDRLALIGARVLAEEWEKSLKAHDDATLHLKKIGPDVT